MDLLNSVELLRRDRVLTPFDRWVDDLHFTCGSFRPTRMDASQGVRGEARRIQACGIEFSHISNDLDRVQRDWDDVRRDAAEQMFLIIQLEGSCGVEHAGRQSALNLGDCILVDSTQPTTFHFGGVFSNHISLNLPQDLMGLPGGDRLDVARTLDADDPMAVVLRALAAEVLVTQEGDHHASNLRQLMISATRQAFTVQRQGFPLQEGLSETAARRLQMIELLIDQNLANPRLSAKWLATRVGLSMRVLQLHFQNLGTTCTGLIRDKRLGVAHDKIAASRQRMGTQTIAEIAYSVGFNDLSYFNRCFKERFACAPSDLARSPPPARH